MRLQAGAKSASSAFQTFSVPKIMKHHDKTKKIINAFYKVYNTLRTLKPLPGLRTPGRVRQWKPSAKKMNFN